MRYKSISFLLFFFPLNICWAQLQITSKHIRVLKAYEKSWSPGMVMENAEPAGGMIYELQLKIRKRGNYDFESILIGDEKLDIEMVQDGKRNLDNTFFKKCSKWQFVARSNKKEVREITDSSMKRIVVENKEITGWILYRYKGSHFVRPIASFEPDSNTPNQ